MENRVRMRQEPHEIFLSEVKSLVKSLYINNPNFKSGYYYGKGSNFMLRDLESNSNLALERIDSLKHLIEPDSEEVVYNDHKKTGINFAKWLKTEMEEYMEDRFVFKRLKRTSVYSYEECYDMFMKETYGV